MYELKKIGEQSSVNCGETVSRAPAEHLHLNKNLIEPTGTLMVHEGKHTDLVLL